MTSHIEREEFAQTIRCEQTRLLYSSTPYSVTSALIISSILSFLEWDFVDHTHIKVWLSGTLIFSLSRMLSWSFYKRSATPNKPLWLHLFVGNAFLSGSIWGSAGVWLFPADSLIGQTILTIAIAGTAAGAVTYYSYMRITAVVFLSTLLAPLSLNFLIGSQHDYSSALGILIALFFVIMISSAMRIYNNTKTNISLRLQSTIDSIAILASKEEADKANNAKSIFLSSMSHELRTPLTAIIGYSEIMKYEAGPLNTEQSESIDNILHAGTHLLGLINEVLDLAKVESEDSAISLSATNPMVELEQCMAIAKSMSKSYGVTVQNNKLNQRLPNIMIDPSGFKQVIINLLSNAIKYNHRGGCVTLSCELNGKDKLRIKIVDNGSGIAKDRQKELFIPFNRLGAESKNIEGTGIGLAITQKLATRMGAELHFESQEGKGSSFWIDVPIAG